MSARGSHNSSDLWIPKPGEIVDGAYRIEEHLDRGGMGVVLRATDLARNQPVAVKLLSPSVANQEIYRERFRREVEVIARIDHPNVLRCFAYGDCNGRPYIVTELLGGDSLKAVIRREGRLSTARALAIGREILAGLAAAHAVDIVHRDIKPENVFVDSDGPGGEVVKVLDFGLAKSISSDENRLTATGLICGTASYVAPEVLVTEAVEKTADVYAVGLVILEMLFGRQVFHAGAVTQTFTQQLVVPARIPRRIWNEPIGGVLVRALNKHPDERYRDAHEMLAAFDETAPATSDFVLDKQEIPPRAPEDLSGFLIDHLADGQNRTRATLRRLPRPEPYDASTETPDDRQTLQMMIDELVSGEHLDAFLDALEPADSAPTVAVSAVAAQPDLAATPSRAWMFAALGLAILLGLSAFGLLATREASSVAVDVPAQGSAVGTVREAPAPTAAAAEPEPIGGAEEEAEGATTIEPAADAAAIAEPTPAPPREPVREGAKSRKPTAKRDAGSNGAIEQAADKLVEQYVPMP